MSPETAIAFGKYGGLGVLNLEGLWTRYDDPTDLLEEVAGLEGPDAVRRMQQIYAEPIRAELITERLREIRDAGVTVAGSLSPQRTKEFAKTVVDAGVDMFVIRGTTVSAEHVSSNAEPLNLKEFIYELDVPVIVGRLRDLPGRPAPDAHRRGRRARRLRRRRRAHDPHGARRRGPDGQRGRRRRRRPSRLHGRVRRPLRARHRRRLHRPQRRHRQGGRLRGRRGDDRRRRSRAPPTPRARASTGAPRPTTPSCPAASASPSRPSAPSRRSCSAPRTWPTGR